MYTDAQIVAMMKGSPKERDAAMKYFYTDRKLKTTVLKIINGMGGTEHDAQDALQEGFKAFYRHLLRGNFEGRSTLHTYFVAICKGCWLAGVKKSYYKRRVLMGDQPVPDQEDQQTPEVELLSKERKAQLEEALGLLGERCRTVILLAYLDGYRDEEIKNQIGISDGGKVRKIRHKCMKKLRGRIEEDAQLYSRLKSLING